MKVLLSMLFMGILDSSCASIQSTTNRCLRRIREDAPPVRPARSGRLHAPGRMPVGRTATRHDSGFVALSNPAVGLELLRRCALSEHAWWRYWMRLQIQYRRLRADCFAHRREVCKRGADIVLSSLLLIALAPLFMLIAALVKFQDGGPVFFAQTRVGRDGREFKMFKIRSMCLNAEAQLQDVLGFNQHQEGITFKLKNDPRITRVGLWLRKLSLDELPQLYNVLKGEMSLVGPRPPVPREVAKYTLSDRRRLAVKPGITCIWQVSGRSQIDFSRQVGLDVDYIENQSLWTDFKILALTLPAMISAKGAC
jgi:lipopolysaccharide/colanic/teichoic acid biosynthesis glycosyltransferase